MRVSQIIIGEGEFICNTPLRKFRCVQRIALLTLAPCFGADPSISQACNDALIKPGSAPSQGSVSGITQPLKFCIPTSQRAARAQWSSHLDGAEWPRFASSLEENRNKHRIEIKYGVRLVMCGTFKRRLRSVELD